MTEVAQCTAHLYIGDDYGDNTSTIRCKLASGHPAEHVETFTRRDRSGDIGNVVTIQWTQDERCYHPSFCVDEEMLEAAIRIYAEEAVVEELRAQYTHCTACGETQDSVRRESD